VGVGVHGKCGGGGGGERVHGKCIKGVGALTSRLAQREVPFVEVSQWFRNMWTIEIARNRE
jgi:hypothetical protein